MASERAHDEGDWPLGLEQPPPGKYIVNYQRAKLNKNRFKDKHVAELHFTVVDPAKWKDTPLVMYCPIPLDGRPGRASKYVRMWELAAGGPAKRRDRMTPSVFAGYWVAEVDHTRRRMVKGGSRELGPTETGTAMIDHLIERAAGGLGGVN